MKPSVAHRSIIKIVEEGQVSTPDLLAVEEPLEIRLGFGSPDTREQKSVSVTMRTPGHDFELALGFLFSEGILKDFRQVESMKYCQDVGRQQGMENVVRVELKPDVSVNLGNLERHFYTTSSCGVCGKTSIDAVRVECEPIESHVTISKERLFELPRKLREAQDVFNRTGGLHASALFDQHGTLEILREDVGRHNALDKVIGAMVQKKRVPLSNSVLLVSGRVSFELVQKAAVAGIPILGAIGAPSSLAVELAVETNMTLIGFLKHDRMNVYSGSNRITG